MSLDAETLAIIKASVPALHARGMEVTQYMYKTMFAERPDVATLFNKAHQASKEQPMALAQSVHAYAMNIDNLAALGPAVALIVNKHCALGVKPEHYGIVGHYLLKALKDVLNLSEGQLAAWGKAYGMLADILIKTESGLYTATAAQEGGWDGYRAFVLEKRVIESETITSFYWRPKDEKKIALFKPGQYLTLQLTFPGPNVVTRNYSLSDVPNGEYYRISVKKERRHKSSDASIPDGLVSCYLHDHFRPGMEINLRAPMGDFFLTPDRSRPLVLLSAGNGLSPLMSMANYVAKNHPDIQTYYIHGAQSSSKHAFAQHMKDLAAEHKNIHVFTCYSHPQQGDEKLAQKTGYLTESWLASILPQKDCDYYFCGPKRFMHTIYLALTKWGVPTARIHYEFFGPSDAEVVTISAEEKKGEAAKSEAAAPAAAAVDPKKDEAKSEAAAPAAAADPVAAAINPAAGGVSGGAGAAAVVPAEGNAS